MSLMPHTIYQRMKMGELKPTRISLQLEDRSISRPLGMVEDIHPDEGWEDAYPL